MWMLSSSEFETIFFCLQKACVQLRTRRVGMVGVFSPRINAPTTAQITYVMDMLTVLMHRTKQTARVSIRSSLVLSIQCIHQVHEKWKFMRLSFLDEIWNHLTQRIPYHATYPTSTNIKTCQFYFDQRCKRIEQG